MGILLDILTFAANDKRVIDSSINIKTGTSLNSFNHIEFIINKPDLTYDLLLTVCSVSNESLLIDLMYGDDDTGRFGDGKAPISLILNALVEFDEVINQPFLKGFDVNLGFSRSLQDYFTDFPTPTAVNDVFCIVVDELSITDQNYFTCITKALVHLNSKEHKDAINFKAYIELFGDNPDPSSMHGKSLSSLIDIARMFLPLRKSDISNLRLSGMSEIADNLILFEKHISAFQYLND